MQYFKAPGWCIRRDFVAADWGDSVRYVEVADDQFAVRQIEVFDNGNVLRYDRSHWCDDFGQLLGLRFSRKPKWAASFPGAEVIEAAEFVVVALTALAGVALFLTGHLATSQVLQGASQSGGIGSAQWAETTTMVAYYPNWVPIAVLAICFAGGALCMVWPNRR
jgi:hypothetical protein